MQNSQRYYSIWRDLFAKFFFAKSFWLFCFSFFVNNLFLCFFFFFGNNLVLNLCHTFNIKVTENYIF